MTTKRQEYPLYSASIPDIVTPLQETRFPTGKLTDLNSPDVVVTEMYVDLQTIMLHLISRNSKWQTITIYADQLYIPSNFSKDQSFVFQLSGKSMTIYAREVFCPNPSGLFISFKNDFVFTCYAHQLTGDLHLSHVGGANIQEHLLTITSGSTGVRLVTDSSDSITYLTSIPEEELKFAKPLYWILHTTYSAARQLVKSHTAVAEDMCAWIVASTTAGGDLVDLRGQSYVLHTRSVHVSKGLHVVPYLNEYMYKEAAEKYLDVAEDYEDAFDAFERSIADSSERQRFVEAMIAASTSTESYLDSLLDLAYTSLEDAISRREDALRDIQAQRTVVDQARSKFDTGVKEYKKNKEREAIFKVITAVAVVAVSVASVAAGNVGGAAIAGGAAEGAVGAAAGVKAAQEAVAAASKVAQVIQKMKKVFENLDQIKASFESIKAAADAVDAANVRIDVTIPVQDDELTEADWDVFSLNVESMMQFAVSEGIDGAADYQRELKIIAIRSKAYVEISNAVIEAHNAYLRDMLARNHQRDLGSIVTDLQNGLRTDKEHERLIQMLLWEQLLNLRGWAVTLIDNQIRAYKYWALDTDTARLEGEVKHDVKKMKTVLAEIERKRISALTSFNPQPQTFHDAVIDLGKKPAFLDTLTKKGKASYQVTLEEPVFRNFGRVRVTNVEVLINAEAIANPTKAYVVLIKTLGSYVDRDAKSNQFSFVGTPMKVGYSRDAGGEVVYESGNGNDNDVTGVQYFQPTVFTTWEVNFTDVLFANVDLTKISDVKLVLSGEAIILEKH